MQISTDEILRRVEEMRAHEEALRAPYLADFRATEEELEITKTFRESEAKSIESEFHKFSRRLEFLCQEGVRFERYLIREGFYGSKSIDGVRSKTLHDDR